MTYLLIIMAAAAAVYLYAAIAYHLGFKKWNPFCGCAEGACAPKRTT